MGFLFGAYGPAGPEDDARARWDTATDWIRASYPDLTLQTMQHGPLRVGTATTLPQESLEGVSKGWQAVAVGHFAGDAVKRIDDGNPAGTEEAAHRLADQEGRFGAVVWDDAATEAFVVTDRTAWNPIFWTHTNGRTVFSSHAGLLLRLLESRPEIDRVGAAQLLMLSFHVGARTVFRGISVLQPGQRLALHAGTPRQGPFELPVSTDGFGATPGHLQERLHNAFLDSLRHRAAGYTHLVLPLSSGMDSRLIAAGLHELGIPFTTSTHDWRGDADWVVARKVSRHLAVEHDLVRLTPQDVADGFGLAAKVHCPNGGHLDAFYRALLQRRGPGLLLAGNMGDCLEGVNLPHVHGSSDELHDAAFGNWRKALWSNEDIQAIGQALGVRLETEAVYAESLDLFRSKPYEPFQQAIWWDYMTFQRRGITYQGRVCDGHMPSTAPYVDTGVWRELLSWPRRMLTDRDGIKGLLRTFYPELARIPLTKGGFLSRVEQTLWGAFIDGMIWRMPVRLRNVLPVCLGGTRPPSPRNFERLLSLLHETAAWLPDEWLPWGRKGIVISPGTRMTRAAKFMALACLLQQLLETEA